MVIDLAFNDGYDKSMNGQSRYDNPYEEDHSWYEIWDLGWLEYYDEETDRLLNCFDVNLNE